MMPARFARHILRIAAATSCGLLLTAPIVAAPLATPTGPSADPVLRWRSFTREAARRFGLPVAWIERVMRAESGGLIVWRGRPTTSSAGAMGLMQLMPQTYAAMRDRHGLGADPQAPRDNIIAGAAYLRAMYDRFGYPGLFAAYNAGPARYAAVLAGRRVLPGETRLYLAKVTEDRQPLVGPVQSPEIADAARSQPRAARAGAASPPSGASLFVDRSRPKDQDDHDPNGLWAGRWPNR